MGDVTRAAPASFVSGDRQKEGIFPLWSVLANISIGRIGLRPALGLVSDRSERLAAAPSAERIRLDLTRFDSRIGELSGGNQQKALVSRAVAAETPIVLLDDPTRGVDVGTLHSEILVATQAANSAGAGELAT
jgi:ribose transport system ATP-binding protein